MREATAEQLRWFTQALLEIRRDTEQTDGYGAPIHFDAGRIAAPLFNLNDGSPQNHIENMLRHIREDKEFLHKNDIAYLSPRMEAINGESVALYDCPTALLETYYRYRLESQRPVFDARKLEFSLGDKTMCISHVKKNGIAPNLCLLLFGHPALVTRAGIPITLASFNAEYPDYAPGDEVDVSSLWHIMQRISDTTDTELRKKRSITDSLRELNERAEEELGVQIFNRHGDSVQVIP